MLRLTTLLVAGIFLAMLIGGRDYGQTRLGLAARTEVAEPPPVAAAPPVVETVALDRAPQPEVTEAAFSPEVMAPVATPVAEPAAEPEAQPIRYVTAASVNVREGPSTRFPVIGKLTRGEALLLVWSEGDGWARILIEGDGIEGYVSSRYLTDIDPLGN